METKLLKAETRKAGYYFDYLIQPDRQPKRHLLVSHGHDRPAAAPKGRFASWMNLSPSSVPQTVFGMVPGECLVSFSASCLEDRYPDLEVVLSDIATSFSIGA